MWQPKVMKICKVLKKCRINWSGSHIEVWRCSHLTRGQVFTIIIHTTKLSFISLRNKSCVQERTLITLQNHDHSWNDVPNNHLIEHFNTLVHYRKINFGIFNFLF